MVYLASLILFGLFATSAAAEPLKLGLYPCCGYLATSVAGVDEVNDAAEPKAVRVSILGTFMNLRSIVYPWLEDELETAWDLGAVPFVNLMGNFPLRTLHSPETGAQWEDYWLLYRWAARIRAWGERGEGRFVYLVPFPEANGPWTQYHDTGPHVARALRTVWGIFDVMGARPYVRVVFGPDAGAFAFEGYYPGSNVVDVVAFSSFPSCTGTMQPYEAIIGPPIQRMRTLAPGKPILVAQTAACGGTVAQREAWTTTLLRRLQAESGVVGVLYFNRDDSGGTFSLPPASWRRAVSPIDPRVTP